MFSKKKRSSPVVRSIDLSIISHSPASKNSKTAADGRQKSHMRLRSRRLPTSVIEELDSGSVQLVFPISWRMGSIGQLNVTWSVTFEGP